jgi:WD40 repeat protein/tRNA A-37 threonylcarbamoyl transferase component Bud32
LKSFSILTELCLSLHITYVEKLPSNGDRPMTPDDTTLEKYIRGELTDEQATKVGESLAIELQVQSTLNRIVQEDTFANELRGLQPAGKDSEEVSKCIERALRHLEAPVEATLSAPRSSLPGTEARPNTSFQDVPGSPDIQSNRTIEIKGYRIVRLLGAGGMGMVYEAFDEKLNRRVALKVMKPEIASHPQHKARFVREAKAAARVEHDNIVSIFHIIDDGDTLCLAMPYLKGEPLDKHFKRVGRMAPKDILKIGRETAQGLAAAHAHGLIHRDIKPGNLWLEKLPEGKQYRVKILDFGLARSANEKDDVITHMGAIVGTPAYMSPEQARGEVVDPRADLFSLGATLYHLCVGKAPFGTGAVMSILTALAVDNPRPVHEINPLIPRALSELISQLLAKNPTQRPQTAKQVVELIKKIEQPVAIPVQRPIDPFSELDIEDHIPSRPDVQKATYRLPRVLIASLLLGLLLISGIAFAGYKLLYETPKGQLVIEMNSTEYEARFRDGQLRIYDKEGKLLYTLKPSEKNKSLPAGSYKLEVLGSDGAKLDTEEFTIQKGQDTAVRVKLRPVEPKRSNPITGNSAEKIDRPTPEVPKPFPELERLNHDSISKDLLSFVGKGQSELVPTELVGSFGTPRVTHSGVVHGLAFSPDSRWLASAGADKVIHLMDVASGEVKRQLSGHTGMVHALYFLKDNKTLISAAADGTLRIWNTETAQELKVIPMKLGPSEWIAMAMSGDGTRVAAGGDSGTIHIWEYGSWDNPEIITDLQKKVRIRTIAFNQGTTLAVGGLQLGDEQVANAYLFDISPNGKIGQRLTATLPTEGKTIWTMRFSRDGKLLASGGSGPPIGGICVWEVSTQKRLQATQIFRDFAHGLDFSADNKTLLVCDGDNQLQIIDLEDISRREFINGNWGWCTKTVTYSPDNKLVAFSTSTGLVQVWSSDFSEQKYLGNQRHVAQSLAVHPHSLLTLLAGNEGVLHRRTLNPTEANPKPTQYRNAVKVVRFSPDGKRYYSLVGTYGWLQDTVYIYDSQSHQELGSFKMPFRFNMAISNDGSLLAASGYNGALHFHELPSGKEVYRFKEKDGLIAAIEFSPDPKYFLSANETQKTLTLWDRSSALPIRTIDTEVPAFCCANDPRYRYLASGDEAGNIVLWNFADGKKARTFSGHQRPVKRLRFTPDGRLLISSGMDGTIRVWNPESLIPQKVYDIENPIDFHSPAFDIDPSGRFLFTASRGLVNIFRLP